MAIYKKDYFINLAEKTARSKNISERELVTEELIEKTASLVFGEIDIFISHRIKDYNVVSGIHQEFKKLGYTPYVDWIDDPQLNRTDVNKKTCTTLKNKMNKSKCLFFVASDFSKESLWMPWELGYMDAKTEKVAILPISENASLEDIIKQQEYLSLYPHVELIKGYYKTELKIIEDSQTQISFNKWLEGEKPKRILRG